MDAVTAAVLADAAFDAVGEATRFSTQRYREISEQIRQSGELPQAMSHMRAVRASEQAGRALLPGLADRWRQVAKSYWALARYPGCCAAGARLMDQILRKSPN
jgi:hypothetical protein